MGSGFAGNGSVGYDEVGRQGRGLDGRHAGVQQHDAGGGEAAYPLLDRVGKGWLG